jgi:hypothetical protein
LHPEGNLGLLAVGEPVEAGDRDDVVTELGSGREPSVIVEVGEGLELARRLRGYWREAPQVQGPVRQP